MAKQRNGINDAFRGSVGTVIGYEWRGQWCMRARPRYVHNPRTAAQQDNRLLFKRVVELTSQLRGVLRRGMRAQSLAMHITEANLFTKSNKGLFRLDAEGRLETEWAQVLVADGPVVPVADPAVETRHAASPGNAVADRETRHAASLQWGNTVTVSGLAARGCAPARTTRCTWRRSARRGARWR